MPDDIAGTPADTPANSPADTSAATGSAAVISARERQQRGVRAGAQRDALNARIAATARAGNVTVLDDMIASSVYLEGDVEVWNTAADEGFQAAAGFAASRLRAALAAPGAPSAASRARANSARTWLGEVAEQIDDPVTVLRVLGGRPGRVVRGEPGPAKRGP